jgi:hypothetical protein
MSDGRAGGTARFAARAGGRGARRGGRSENTSRQRSGITLWQGFRLAWRPSRRPSHGSRSAAAGPPARRPPHGTHRGAAVATPLPRRFAPPCLDAGGWAAAGPRPQPLIQLPLLLFGGGGGLIRAGAARKSGERLLGEDGHLQLP